MILEYDPFSLHKRGQYSPQHDKKVENRTVASYFSKVAKNHDKIAYFLFQCDIQNREKNFYDYSYKFSKELSKKGQIISFIDYESYEDKNDKSKFRYNEEEVLKILKTIK